jgi:hypothetical protein
MGLEADSIVLLALHRPVVGPHCGPDGSPGDPASVVYFAD